MRPCDQCPWRLSNQGKPHPDGWYTQKNLRRLWAGLRNGESMSCHPTDPDNPISEKAQAAGYTPAKDSAQTQECMGGLIIQQREMMRAQDDLAGYARARKGMTKNGLRVLVTRALLGGLSVRPTPMPRPDLNEPDIGASFLPPWEPR